MINYTPLSNGIRGNLLAWIKDSVLNRSQRVVVDGQQAPSIIWRPPGNHSRPFVVSLLYKRFTKQHHF